MIRQRVVLHPVNVHPSIWAEPPTKTLADDIASLRSLLTAYADQGRNLIVVEHPYSGVVTSSAVEGLTKSARAQAGKTDGVVKVVYLSAFVLVKGQTLLGMLGGNYLPWIKVETIHADGAGEINWHEIHLVEREKWNGLALHTSRAVFSGELTYEVWRDIPSVYIISEDDRTLLPAFQELFAATMGAENTYRLPSSHSPFLGMLDRLVGVLEQIATA